MEFIGQVISDFKIDLITGFGFLILGIIIPAFKLYWLIAGVNTASKKELESIDLKYVGNYFGIFIGGLGLLRMLNPFIFSYFGLRSYVQYSQMITIFSVVIFMFIFGSLKKNRIYKLDIDKNKK